MRLFAGLFVLALVARAEEWKAGPLTMTVHISRTANLFEIVDNLSAWSGYSHAQYREHYNDLSDEDLRMLQLHATIRRARGWGAGLEQTFFSPLDLDAAIARGIEKGHITAEEAEVERKVLLHFAARIDKLLADERERLEAWRATLHTKLGDLAAFSKKISRFCHGREIHVPVYLIANPADHSYGGGYNGGRLTIEIAHKGDVYPTFLHELMHAFVNEERARLEAARERVADLDYTTLNEGIAYALSPGLFHVDQSLAAQVAVDLAAGKDLDDEYARFRRYGLALLPLLKEALDREDATLETFLPRALDAWRVLRALDAAQRGAGQRDGATLHFSAGPGWRTLGKRVGELYSFDHSAEHYEKVFLRARKGDTFVLLFALDHSDRAVPQTYRDLLPRPWAEIEKKLRNGATLELDGEARGMRIVVLAAPTQEELRKLIQTSKRLDAPKKRRGRSFFAVGCDKRLYGVLNRRAYELHNRGVAGYNQPTARLFARSQSGDTLVILQALDMSPNHELPAKYYDLLPKPWAEVEGVLKAGATVELRGEARGFKTILLAAPTTEELEKLVRTTEMLK